MTYRGNIPRYFGVHGLNHFILWLPIWVVFFQREGLSLTEIGILDASAWVVSALLEVPTGGVADRWGRKASIFIGTLLNAVAMFLILTEVLSPIFLFGFLLWGGANTFISGADMALLYDSLKADGREAENARITGRYNAVMQGSQGVAAVIGAWVATIDPALCFALTGIAGFGGAAIALTLREPPRHERGERALGYIANLRTAISIASRTQRVRWLLLLTALWPVVPFAITFVLLQPYALYVGLPLASLGIVVFAVRIVGVFGAAFGHRLARRVALAPLTFTGIATLAAVVALLAAVPSIPALALVPLVTLTSSIVRPLLAARTNELIPSAQRATIISLGSLVFTMAIAISEPALFRIADLAGPTTALAAAAFLFAGLTGPLAFLWNAAERGTPLAPEPVPVAPEPAGR